MNVPFRNENTKSDIYDVSIILINYNTNHFLQKAILSIFKHSKGISFEIIVVDNASEEFLDIKFLKQFQNVKIIFNKTNSGFSRANNIGAKNSTGKYLLFLNSDTEFIEDSLYKCLTFLDSHKNPPGVVGCRLLNKDGTLQQSFHWSAVNFLKVIQSNPLYILFFKDKIQKKYTSKISEQHQRTQTVRWISGAFMLMPRGYFDTHGYVFDEDFFMYNEDVELCLRLKKQGYSVTYFPETSIIHYGGGGYNVPISRYNQIFLSELLAVMKAYGKPLFLCYIMLLRLNHSIDQLLLWLKPHAANYAQRKQIVRNRMENKLIKKYFFKILFDYKSGPNSGKTSLKHD